MRAMEMRLLAVLAATLILGLCWTGVSTAAEPAAAGSADEALQGILNRLDLTELESFSRQVSRDVSPYLPETRLADVIAAVKAGEPVLDPRELFAGITRYLWGEVQANSRVMGQLLVLAVLCAVLRNLQAAFARPTVGDLAHFVVLLALVTLALGSFTLAMQTGRETVDRMTSFMQALLPVILTLITAMGGVATGAILSPITLSCLTLGGSLVKNVVLPLLYFAAVINIVGRLSDRFQVSRLSDVLKTVTTASLGLFCTLAVGILTIQTTAGKAADTLTLRTAKFASTTFVPVVGKTLTDAVEVVASVTGLAKTAVGLLGMLILVGIALFPALKIAVLALIYHATAALIQPFGDKSVSDTLNAMGGTLGLTFAAVVAVGLFFFLALSVVYNVGNFGLM